jgi:hypothetical protein
MTVTEKKLKALVREHADRAWEAEMRAAMGSLAVKFDEWKAGRMSTADLNAAIHKYHDGASREIWKRYSTNDPSTPLAHAVASGVIEADSLPPEILEHIASKVEFFRREE